jgi:hypothetical protein
MQRGVSGSVQSKKLRFENQVELRAQLLMYNAIYT